MSIDVGNPSPVLSMTGSSALDPGRGSEIEVYGIAAAGVARERIAGEWVEVSRRESRSRTP